MNREVEIIVLRETALQSLISDAGTFVMVMSIGMIGWWLDETLLKVIGGIMIMITFLSKSQRSSKRLSISEARARLDEIEQEKA